MAPGRHLPGWPGGDAGKARQEGPPVYVSGKLQTRKWRKDGEDSDRFSTEILLVPGGALARMARHVPVGGTVSAAALMDYRSLLPREQLHYLGHIAAFLKFWVARGYTGVDRDVLQRRGKAPSPSGCESRPGLQRE